MKPLLVALFASMACCSSGISHAGAWFGNYADSQSASVKIQGFCDELASAQTMRAISAFSREDVIPTYVITLMETSAGEGKKSNVSQAHKTPKMTTKDSALLKAITHEAIVTIVNTGYQYAQRLDDSDLAAKASHECSLVMTDLLSDSAYVASFDTLR